MNPVTRRIRALTAAAACALLLAACGGDDAPESETSATTAPVDATSDVEGADETPDPPADPEPDAAEDEAAAPPETRVALLDADGFVFSPTDVTITAGETVVWEHEGRISHTVTADDDSFASGTMAAGDTFEVTFDEAGSYPYVCDFHGTMRGTITVS